MSARKKIKPEKITVYTDGQQDSCWWRRALPYIEHQLIYNIPGDILLNNVRMKHLEHKADFLRLIILYYNGGIYMDTDILSLNSLDPVLQHQVVVAEECGQKINVAMMMAQRQSCFICNFAHFSCRKFKGTWSSHSLRALTAFVKTLNKEKEGILVLPWKTGFYPLCWTKEGIDQLYGSDFADFPDYNISDIYTVHFYRKSGDQFFYRTLEDFNWIQTSKSLAAISVRESIPPQFSPLNLNVSEVCDNIPLPD